MGNNSSLNEVKATIFKVQGFLEFIKNMIAYEELFLERIDFIEMLKEIEFFLENELKKLKEIEKETELKSNQHQLGDD